MQNNIWLTSDLHFGHTNILYFHKGRRDALGITLEDLQSDKEGYTDKMDEWLIEKWNSTVNKQDHVYFLGDFCLKNKEYAEKLLKKLKGKKFLIRGNHDRSLVGLENYFVWVGDRKELKLNPQEYDFIDTSILDGMGKSLCFELDHFPELTWNRRTNGTIHLHGHCHGSIDDFNLKSRELRVDVGFDGSLGNYNFINIKDIYDYFKLKLDGSGFKTFKEYTEALMQKQGFKM